MVNINSEDFGITKNGDKVTTFILQGESGMRVRVLDFGATVQSVEVPDRNGNLTDVVLGYDDIGLYETGTCYYGAVVGRYANRIGNARFVLDGKEYILEKTPGESNHVHGVYSKRMFEASVDGGELVLRYFSPDGEEGFPGNLNLEVRYLLREDNALDISYKAVSDRTTVVNLTNHSYFNLNGQDGSVVLDHEIQLNCGHYTEYADSFAQTGNVIPVDGTPMDFRKAHTMGERFGDEYYQLRICTGYDHNMVIDGKDGELKRIGSAKSGRTGIALEAFTTEPAVHFYSGNYMGYDAAPYGKNKIHYPKNGGFCFEAQHYPDSVNHPNFPSTVLRPGEVYRQKTIYRFSVV